MSESAQHLHLVSPFTSILYQKWIATRHYLQIMRTFHILKQNKMNLIK